MSDEIEPHVETTLDDYKAYAYHIREDAKSRGVENTRLSIYGIYMAVIEKQAAELERYETARQEDARRMERIKGERDALRETLESIKDKAVDAQGDWHGIQTTYVPYRLIPFVEIEAEAAALKDAK